VKARWFLIAAVVTLAHLILLSQAVQMVSEFLQDEASPQIISVQMVSPSVPNVPRMRPKSAAQAPAFIPAPSEAVAQASEAPALEPEREFMPEPVTELAAENPVDPDGTLPQGTDDPAPASLDDLLDFAADGAPMAQSAAYSDLQPELEDLPRAGAIAIDAFWGEFTEGARIAEGFIEISFPEDGRYQIRLVTKALSWAALFARKPLQAETSGVLGPGGFRPERYSHLSPRGREERMVFDYEKGKVNYSSLNEDLPLQNGTQDRLSFMIQLAWMMKVDPERFGLGQQILIPMAGRKEVEEIIFTVVSNEHLVLPGGVLVPAVHLSSYQKRERFSGRIDVWLDRVDRLLPVRIRFEEKRGQVIDLLATRR
jgi:hypothetical protein